MRIKEIIIITNNNNDNASGFLRLLEIIWFVYTKAATKGVLLKFYLKKVYSIQS